MLEVFPGWDRGKAGQSSARRWNDKKTGNMQRHCYTLLVSRLIWNVIIGILF